MTQPPADMPRPRGGGDQATGYFGLTPATGLVLFAAAALVAVTAYVGFRFDPPFALPGVADAAAPAGDYIQSARQAGVAGLVMVIMLYALGVLIAAPSSVLTLTVTLIYGVWAIPIAWLGAMAGLAGAFWLARRGLSAHVQWFCERYPVTRGMERALRANGFWLVLLMRQSPVIPFAAQNYLFAMLGTPLRGYLVGSALGLVPGTVLKVLAFSGAQSALADDWGTPMWAMVGAGAVATVVVMIIIGRAVRIELKRLEQA